MNAVEKGVRDTQSNSPSGLRNRVVTQAESQYVSHRAKTSAILARTVGASRGASTGGAGGRGRTNNLAVRPPVIHRKQRRVREDAQSNMPDLLRLTRGDGQQESADGSANF